ncbi:MAG: hypothetical protein V2A78_02090 [bacterium]
MENKVDVWFAREGEHTFPAGKPTGRIDEKKAVELLITYSGVYQGTPMPKITSKNLNPDLDGVRDTEWVVLEIHEKIKFYEKGFYILQSRKAIPEIREWLKAL